MDGKLLDSTKLLTKLHKMGTSKCKHGIGGLALVHSKQRCRLKASCAGKRWLLSTICDTKCDTNSIDLDCFKIFDKFHFVLMVG